MRKFAVVMAVLVGFGVIWFWPNIYGHYRFKQYCEREGGLQVNGTVLPDQGWLAVGTDPHDCKAPFYLGKVAFVRYQDQDGKRFDVYAKTNPWPKDPDYIFNPVDESKSVKYTLKYVNEPISNELRLGKNQMMVLSAETNEIIISFTNLVYSQFEQSNTLLNAPSVVYCPDIPLNIKDFSKIIYK